MVSRQQTFQIFTIIFIRNWILETQLSVTKIRHLGICWRVLPFGNSFSAGDFRHGWSPEKDNKGKPVVTWPWNASSGIVLLLKPQKTNVKSMTTDTWAAGVLLRELSVWNLNSEHNFPILFQSEVSSTKRHQDTLPWTTISCTLFQMGNSSLWVWRKWVSMCVGWLEADPLTLERMGDLVDQIVKYPVRCRPEVEVGNHCKDNLWVSCLSVVYVLLLTVSWSRFGIKSWAIQSPGW